MSKKKSEYFYEGMPSGGRVQISPQSAANVKRANKVIIRETTYSTTTDLPPTPTEATQLRSFDDIKAIANELRNNHSWSSSQFGGGATSAPISSPSEPHQHRHQSLPATAQPHLSPNVAVLSSPIPAQVALVETIRSTPSPLPIVTTYVPTEPSPTYITTATSNSQRFADSGPSSKSSGMPMARLAEEEFSGEAHDSYDDGGGAVRNVFAMPECPITWITVYQDKAEVSRVVRPRVVDGGISEVVLKRLSPSIDKDSIRVVVRGAATIQDVSYHTRRLQEDEAQLTKAQHELREKIKHQKSQMEMLHSKQHRMEKQRNVLDTFADTLIDHKDGEVKEPPKENGPVDAYDPKHMETLSSFFGLYENQAERLDDGLLKCKEDMEKTVAAIKDLEKLLKDLELRHDEQMARELTILVESRETTQVELYVSYIVNNCKWTPSYDIRIFNSDGNMKDTPQYYPSGDLKIVYYGLVQQATGEDWETSQLILSTSQPGIGGTVPDLGVQRIHFKNTRSSQFPPLASPILTSPKQKKYSSLRRSRRAIPSSGSEPPESPSRNSTLERNDELAFELKIDPTSPMGTLRRPADSNQHTTSTQFEVPRPPAIIPCDNEQHRVTVAIIDLQPTFEYISAPKRSPFAYLKAAVQNLSKFALLPGTTNIYVDNNFVGRSQINAVAPNEEFQCFLGTDHGIKISYNPMFKYKEVTSSGGKNASVTFKQVIEIRNTHERTVRILVMDQLPISAEDKIKVTLLEPVIKHPEKYDKNKPVRINKANNVEWDLEIPSGEVKELVLKYVVEHPVCEEVDVSFSEV